MCKTSLIYKLYKLTDVMSTMAVKKSFLLPGNIPLPPANSAIEIGVMYEVFEILTKMGVWFEL